MKKLLLITLLALAAMPRLAAFDEDDFATGVFVLNEDWYGHQNSTINMWYPDNEDDPFNPVFYRVFQYKNADHELGCTAQYAQIFGGKIYIMAKQHKDPGASVRGGRLTVVDAKTMKMISQHDVINPEGNAYDTGSSATGVISGTALGDGRSCCGVTPEKIYLGTSNGIFIYSPQRDEVVGRIAGTENPLMKGDENNIDGQGPLYQNQIGIMIRTQDYVFAIMQDRGVLVIDPATDQIVDEIPGCFSTMVQSADGNLWVGENLADPSKVNAFGVPYTHYPYGDNGSEWLGNGLLCINPYTLETRRVTLTLEGAGVPQSWYAWTAGKLCASAKRNVLYFTYVDPAKGQDAWFSDCKLFRYDIDTGSTTEIYDSSTENLWFYSSSLRVSPVDDRLYAHFYVGNNIATKNWVYQRFEDKGTAIKSDASAKLIANYWYPAMFVFPDNFGPEIHNMPSTLSIGDKPFTLPLADKVTDRDTPVVSIVKRITANSNPQAVKAEIVRGELVLTPVEGGSSQITVTFDSNGLLATHTITVNATSGILETARESVKLEVNGNTLSIFNATSGASVSVFTLQGIAAGSATAGSDGSTRVADLPRGVLIVAVGEQVYRVIIK